MKSAGKRFRNCEVCKGRLPAGSRVDRKYCCAACITRAYYQRHPEKKRVLSSRTRKQAEAEAHTRRRSDEIVNKLARLEAENTTLRQRLDRALSENNELTVDLPPRSYSQALDSTRTALKEAERRIAELETDAQAATKRADSAEQQLATAQQRIAELQRQPKAEPPQMDGAEMAGKQTESLQRHATKEPSSTRAISAPLLWEWFPQTGQPPIAKWRGWPAASFDRLRAFSQKAMDALHSEMYKQGERRLAKVMREWLAMPGNIEPMTELCFRIVLLSVCTDRQHRRKKSQREQLAVLALDGALATMAIDARDHEQEIKKILDGDRLMFERLALELVNTCRGKVLKFSSQKGRWYLPKID